jgi:hypothetical protein
MVRFLRLAQVDVGVKSWVRYCLCFRTGLCTSDAEHCTDSAPRLPYWFHTTACADAHRSLRASEVQQTRRVLCILVRDLPTKRSHSRARRGRCSASPTLLVLASVLTRACTFDALTGQTGKTVQELAKHHAASRKLWQTAIDKRPLSDPPAPASAAPPPPSAKGKKQARRTSERLLRGTSLYFDRSQSNGNGDGCGLASDLLQWRRRRHCAKRHCANQKRPKRQKTVTTSLKRRPNPLTIAPKRKSKYPPPQSQRRSTKQTLPPPNPKRAFEQK